MPKHIYDNSNLAESYSGTTTPLTFSFARFVYQEVYKNFCYLMGVGKKTVVQNETMFSQMLVFVGYRMYYDLLNWYKLIAFLPGYKFNRNFLEKMMGVEKEYNYQTGYRTNIFYRCLIGWPILIWQASKIIAIFLMMGRLVRKFSRQFDRLYLQAEKVDLAELSSEKIFATYENLAKQLTTKWRVPIANDLAVMISTGLAEKLHQKWIQSGNIYEILHAHSHDKMMSLDPGQEIEKIVESIKKDDASLHIFKIEAASSIAEKIASGKMSGQIPNLILDYLAKFGSRSPNELKLESITLKERPADFISLIKNSLDSENFKTAKDDFVDDQAVAGKNISSLKKIIYFSLINWAIKSINRREETRFKRSLIFGFARKIFLTLGKKFTEQKILNTQRDIFFLSIDEVAGLLNGKLAFNTARDMVENRKTDFATWRQVELPRRIETDKEISELEQELLQNLTPDVNEKLSGLVASRGKITELSGTALVLDEFEAAAEFGNKILVTKQTDPGWSIVFPILKGIVVERGGMLSHAAVLARELKIPCIVGVENATKLISNNSLITLNLISGEIKNE